MNGFATTADAPTRKPLPLVAQCGACQLYKGCKFPKMSVDGKGRKKILVVAEAPGKTEDEQNRPLIGPSGELVWSTLSKHGVERDDCWVTNAVICRPPENKLPPQAIEHCRPNIVKVIRELRPRTIILLGASAVKSVIGWQWKEDVGAAGRWDGWRVPCQELRAWLCPTWHPAYVLRADGENNPVVRLLFEKHLEAACKLEGRPPKTPELQTIVEMDVDAAANIINEFHIAKLPVAWDLECDRLKPDHPEASIVCCAVCNGAGSIAFPWHGAAKDAMVSLLKDRSVPKWGWNQLQYDARWIRRLLGFWPQGMEWDGMQATHILDNRPDVCGLSFQKFVRLGLPDHKEDMGKWLKTKGSNTKNKAWLAPLDRLLKYCSEDAAATWLICEQQRKEMGQ